MEKGGSVHVGTEKPKMGVRGLMFRKMATLPICLKWLGVRTRILRPVDWNVWWTLFQKTDI